MHRGMRNQWRDHGKGMKAESSLPQEFSAGDEAMTAQDRWTRELTTGNTRHSCRSYLRAPGSRHRWRRGRWSSGPCPCGRWPGWSRSGARCSRRGSGTGRWWGTGTRRCRSCRAARRTPCTRTAGLRRSPGSCVPQGSCSHQGKMGPLDWEKTAMTGSTEDFKTHFGDTLHGFWSSHWE